MSAPAAAMVEPKALEVTLDDGKRRSAALAYAPAGATRGVVVIHEIFGARYPEIDRVCANFASKGYAVCAPDLFAGCVQPVCLVKSLQAVMTGKGPQLDTIFAARDWITANAKVDKAHIGIIGFCLGGGFALAAGPGFGAVSTNYGDIPPAKVLEQSPPVIGCYGGRDLIMGRNGKKLDARLPKSVLREIHDFPSV
ncbi:MAG: dienelactone hydrolase family protein, partial [Deltaproteobacteria bacterium]|nr:dienelactone hydrolase family protein [Deltaproteobacteria bacterium]